MTGVLRLVLDLRACQATGGGGERGAFALSFARSLAKVSGEHELLVALDGSQPDSIPALKATLADVFPPERIVVYSLPRPVGGATAAGPWRLHAAAAVRRTFFEWLGADLVHESDWTAWPDGADLSTLLPRQTPLVRAATYWPGDPPPGTLNDVLIPAADGEEAVTAALEAFVAAVVRRRTVKPTGASRPRLALVSPLPPQNAALADHVALLLSALEPHYRVEFVVDQAGPDPVPGTPDLQRRSFDWFDARAGEYERVLYSFDDPRSDDRTLALLARHAGAVVLHESFFAGTKDPRGGDVIRAADGVIVRSESSARLLEQWYGEAPRGDLAVVTPSSVPSELPTVAGAGEYLALEQFAVSSTGAAYRRLVDALGSLADHMSSSRSDLVEVATSIAENRPRQRLRQLLVDVSELVVNDFRTGIQRVSRAVAKRLIDDPPADFTVELVYGTPEGLRYARRYASLLLGLPAPVDEDALVEAGPGDHFLGVDLSYRMVRSARSQIVALRNRGVRVDFVVYDMLPVLRPEWFPPEVPEPHHEWLRTVAAIADGLVCISDTVADELLEWLDREPPERAWPLDVGSFALGADVASTVPTSGGGRERADAVAFVSARPTFMMVGTVEPRKGHAQALGAFERLWASGIDCGLLIIGKEGWGVGELLTRLRAHPERGKHLLWLDGASDDVLLDAYSSATALLAASEGEGFGLPLVEAAQHGLPAVARDLPVFREVAGEHAFFFSGERPEDLAAAIRDWLALDSAGEAPQSLGMPRRTWAQSTTLLLDCVSRGGWRSSWPVPERRA